MKFLLQLLNNYKLDLSKKGTWLQVALTLISFLACLSSHHTVSTYQVQVDKQGSDIKQIQEILPKVASTVQAAKDTMEKIDARAQQRFVENRQLIESNRKTDSIQSQALIMMADDLQELQKERLKDRQYIKTMNSDQMVDYMNKYSLPKKGGKK